MTTLMIDLANARFCAAKIPAQCFDASDVERAWLSTLNPDGAVGLHFGRVNDGRGYSLACRLREKYPMIELYAIGHVHEDMLYFLRRCGFRYAHLLDRTDSVVERQASDELMALLFPFSHEYQVSAGDEQFPNQKVDATRQVMDTAA